MADDLDAYTRRLFHIESGGNPNAVTGSNRGMAQFSPDLERRYGINDQNRTDPAAQANAVAQERAEHAAALRRTLGRDPTPGELYLAHQQGLAGATALLSNPDAPAWQAVRPYYKSDDIARSAIWGNVPANQPGTAGFNRNLYPNGADSITAGEFARQWINKFENGGGNATGAPVAGVIPPPSQPPPSQPPPDLSGAVAMQTPPPGGLAPTAGMLSGTGLSGQQTPNLGMLAQLGQRMMQPQASPPPISYAAPVGAGASTPLPHDWRNRLAALALGRQNYF